MCLAIPGRVLQLNYENDVLMGKVEFGDISKRVCLEHVPEVKPGDYVLVHVGFALSRIDEAEAKRIFGYLEELKQLGELEEPAPPATGGARSAQHPKEEPAPPATGGARSAQHPMEEPAPPATDGARSAQHPMESAP